MLSFHESIFFLLFCFLSLFSLCFFGVVWVFLAKIRKLKGNTEIEESTGPRLKLSKSFRFPVTVVGNRARMGGSERFWVGKYDDGGGLSEKVVFWPEIIDKAGSFGGLRFPVV